MKIKFDKDEFISSNPYLNKNPKYSSVTREVEIPDKLIRSAIIIVDELHDRAWDELQNIWDDQIEFPLVPFPFFLKYREPENEGGDYWITHWLIQSLSNNISNRAECIEIFELLGGLEIIKSPVINLKTGNFKGEVFVLAIDPPVLDYLKALLVKEAEKLKVESTSDVNTVRNIPKKQPIALELNIIRGNLCLSGGIVRSTFNSNEVIIRRLRESNSTVLLEQTIRVCKISPTAFKKITKNDLENKSGVGINVLKEAIGAVGTFRQYISNVGLKKKLGDLFYATSSSDMGYQFRLGVTLEEWQGLSKEVQETVMQDLVNIKKQ